MRIFRVLLGIFLIVAIVGIDKFYQKNQLKKQTAIKGVQSAQLDLPAIEISPIPMQKNKLPAPSKFREGVLMDVGSGMLLFSKEAHKPVPIASLTKLATAAVVLDKYDLDEQVIIPKDAALVIGSKIFASQGEKFKMRDLLNALLIMSANDAAVALAEHKYSQDDFVVLMNQKAREIGMKNTNFKDPAGLNDEGLSSAYDVAVLLSYSLKNPFIRQIIKTDEKTIYNLDKTKSYRLKNSDRLVKKEMYFEGIIGGKTGFTPQAGHNLAAAASRNGHTLVAVIINTYVNTKDASAIAARDLLNWGFENWRWVTP